MDEMLDTTPPPRRRRRVWVAAIVAAALAAAAVTGLVFTRSLGDPGDPVAGIPVASTAVVVFLHPDAGDPQKAAVAAYLETLDVVGEVTLESHAEAYNQLVQLYGGGEVPDSVDAGSVLESYRFRIATAVDPELVMMRLRSTPGVREVIVQSLVERSPLPFDEGLATELRVFLKDDASPFEKVVIEVYLKSLRTVRGVVFRTRAQAYQGFAVMFSATPELVKQTLPEALPEVFLLSLVDAADIDPTVARLRTFPGVDVASPYRDLIHR